MASRAAVADVKTQMFAGPDTSSLARQRERFASSLLMLQLTLVFCAFVNTFMLYNSDRVATAAGVLSAFFFTACITAVIFHVADKAAAVLSASAAAGGGDVMSGAAFGGMHDSELGATLLCMPTAAAAGSDTAVYTVLAPFLATLASYAVYFFTVFSAYGGTLCDAVRTGVRRSTSVLYDHWPWFTLSFAVLLLAVMQLHYLRMRV